MAFLGRAYLPLCCALLFCLLLGCVTVESITAKVGSNVTLPCNYDAQRYGRLSVCWGRGAIPNSGCNNEVIRSDGTSVTSRLSKRYQLMGNLGGGDVSLTIRQVGKADSGTYGCRVEIPGWFNDHKHEVTLTVKTAPPDPLRLVKKEVKEKSITFGWTCEFDGGEPILSYNLDLQKNQETWQTTTIEHGELPQLTLVDLNPATTYKFRMFAINSVGMSEVSNLLIVKTREAAPDGPPLDLKLESLTSHSIRVTWKPPKPELRNGILLSYSISYREYDHASKQYKRWHHVSVPASREIETVVLDNLKPSTSYGVIVQAKTSAGIGPAATAPLCSTLDRVHTTTTLPTTESASTPATIWIQDTSSIPLAPDGPPLDLKLESLTSHSIRVTWKPPKPELRNGILLSYSISYREYDHASEQYKRWHHVSVPASREIETVVLDNLKPSTSYGVIVQAKTSAGIGPAATAPLCSTLDIETGKSTSTPATIWIQDTSSIPLVHATTTEEPVPVITVWEDLTTSTTSVAPDPPVVELKEVQSHLITISWTPGFDGGSPITGYYLDYKEINNSWDYTDNIRLDISPGKTEATIFEINHSTYNIRMFAKNSYGTSKASNVLTITIEETVHQRDDLFTTASSDNRAAPSIEEDSKNVHLATIVVPVVLVVLLVAIVSAWQLRRMKRKTDSMNLWLTGGALHFRSSEPLQEL